MPGNSHDGDDSGLWSPFEEDRDEDKVTPKKRYINRPWVIPYKVLNSFPWARSSKGKEASRVSSDGQDDVYLEDFDTRYAPFDYHSSFCLTDVEFAQCGPSGER